MHDIVSEDGMLRTKEIFYIIRQLCLLRGNESAEIKSDRNRHIHPKNVHLSVDGTVRLSNEKYPFSVIGTYLPPELDRADPMTPAAEVYALGMLMLFMATGKEKKTDADAVVGDHFLFSLIERCTAFDPKERIQDTGKLLDAVRQRGRGGRNLLFALMILAFICLLFSFIFCFWQQGKRRGSAVGEAAGFASGYASGYEQGLSDAPGIGLRGAAFDANNGNLPGNLTAGGGAVSAFSGDSVFFLFEGNIFRMDPYTEDMEIIVPDSGAHDLHYYDGFVYYCTNENIVRVDPVTKRIEVFCDSHTGQLYIFDNAFYLYENRKTDYLYKIDPVKKTVKQLNGAMKYLCLQIIGDQIYYIAPDRENSIYCCDLDGGNDLLVSSNAYESFCIYDGKLYAGTESGLIRMDLNGGNSERLTAHPASFPNVSDAGIFYVSGSEKTLEWLSFDNKTRYTIVSSRTGSFNVAGQWIFYQNEDDGGTLWRIRASGADNAKVTK